MIIVGKENAMRRKMIYLLLLLVFALAFSGCNAKKEGSSKGLDSDMQKKPTEKTDSETEQTKPEEMEKKTANNIANNIESNIASNKEIAMAGLYSDILDEFYNIVSNYSEDLMDAYDDADKLGIFERLRFTDTPENCDKFGYTIEDFSGDGIPELIISQLGVNEKGEPVSIDILNIYTISGEGVKSIIESTIRDRNYYLGDGIFYNQGSAGAMHYISNVYKLSKDGQKTECIDFYFTDEKDSVNHEIGYYHNQVGVMDKAVSEELKVTEEEFWDMDKKISERIKAFESHSFEDYRPGQYSNLPVGIAYSKKSELDYAFDYDSFRVDEEQYQVKATLYAKKDYRDFKVLELSYDDVDAQGNPKFKTKVVYETPELSFARPFLLGLEFLGDMPGNGISFVDENGKTRKFMIYQSGKDGSLIISEF